LDNVRYIFYNPEHREWYKALDLEQRKWKISSQTIGQLGQDNTYPDEYYYVVFIHLHKNEFSSSLKEEWEKLKDSTREKVLWLVVSGGAGYPLESSWTSRVHFLRYPLDRKILARQEVAACFLKFRHHIEESIENFINVDWTLLYPPQNDFLVAIAAILSAGKVCGEKTMQEALKELTGTPEYINTAYEQYLAGIVISGLDAKLTRSDFEGLSGRAIRTEELNKILQEINRILGAVPD
jgi:hypothetical protein